MKQNQPIDIAVFPVAGFGTRFLPLTKASPKEMLPIVDKPLIQYAAEEAIAAGIKKLVFISGKGKRSIEDHFDHTGELQAELKRRGKEHLIPQLNFIPEDVTCVYVRQKEQAGLGAAVLCARPVVADKPFALLLPDDFIPIKEPYQNCTAQLINVWNQYGCSAIATESIPESEIQSYGIIGGERTAERLLKIKRIIEKPSPAETSDRNAIIGRYVLDNKIFECLEHLQPGIDNEVQLTDAIKNMIKEKPIMAYEHHATRFDCGNKKGYIRATIMRALQHPELSADTLSYIKECVARFK